MFQKIQTIALVIAGLLVSPDLFAQSGHAPGGGHLSFKNNTLHIHASFLQDPTVGTEAPLVLEAKNPSTHQTTELDDKIEVVLWMPSMGHGSSPTKIERAIDAAGNIIPGTFKVRNLFFIMGGEWEVRVTLTDANGVIETQSFSITLAGGHHH